MSVAKQAIAARGKAKQDKRYAKLSRKDASVRALRLQRQLAREQERRNRK